MTYLGIRVPGSDWRPDSLMNLLSGFIQSHVGAGALLLCCRGLPEPQGQIPVLSVPVIFTTGVACL